MFERRQQNHPGYCGVSVVVQVGEGLMQRGTVEGGAVAVGDCGEGGGGADAVRDCGGGSGDRSCCSGGLWRGGGSG